MLSLSIAVFILLFWCSLSWPQGWQRYVARVMYDGTDFKGWQAQGSNRIRTVQGVIANKLRIKYSEPISVTGASRTDHSVHSRGQCMHFDMPSSKIITDLNAFEYSFNRMIPSDIRIYNVTAAPAGRNSYPFHAIASATGKLYVYRFCVADIVDPLRSRYCAHIWQDLDINTLQRCLSQFVGSHDFRAYANQIERAARELEASGMKLETVRTVESIKLVEEGGGYFRVEFRVQSALYRMLRNIMGASVRVATGLMSEEQLLQLLHEAPSRSENPAKSAVPQGLTLERVFYDHY